MKLPEGVTLHSRGNVYRPGDEVPKELEQFLPDHVRSRPAPASSAKDKPA